MVAQATRLDELHQERDRELVHAHQAGDRSAFPEIVATHYPALLNQAYRRLRDRPEAEDAVQETLIRAYRHLDSFGGDFRLGPWMARILSNVCADQCHRRANEVHLAERLTLLRHPDASDPADGLRDDAAYGEVRDALGALPRNYREAFVLRELEERPYSEVAAITGVTEQNARARVHRARAALRRHLSSIGTGAAALMPWRWLHGAFHVVPRSLRSGKDALAGQVGSNLAAIGETGGSATSYSAGSLASTASQVATQLAANPAAQMVLGTGGPSKSSIVIGVAATIASTTAAVIPGAMAPGRSSQPSRAAQTIVASASPSAGGAPQAGAAPTPTTPATAPVPATAQPTPAAATSTKPASSPPTTQAPAPAPAPKAVTPPWWLSMAEGVLAGLPGSGGSHPTTTSAPAPSGDKASTPTDPRSRTASGSSQVSSTPMLGDGSGSTPASGSPGTSSASASGSAAGKAPGDGTSPRHSTLGTTSGSASGSPIAPPSGGCPWMIAFPGATPQQVPLPPPGAFQPVGLAKTTAVQLSETGPTLMASASTQLTDVSGGPSSAIHLLYGACLPPGGAPALIVDVTSSAGGGSSEVQLRGSFVQQLGTATNAAYLFRGVVVPLNGASALPGAISTATRFVADLRVAQPYNTAKLSLVFLCSTAGTSGTTPGSSASGSGTSSPGGSSTAGASGSSTSTTSTTTPGSSPSSPNSPSTLSTAPTYSTYDPNPNGSTASTAAGSGTPAAGSGGSATSSGTAPGSAPLTSSTIPGTSTTTNG